jgi:hypothetical protein
MVLRRMLFLVALLLLVSVVAGSVVDRERDEQQATAPPRETSTPPVQQVTAELPATQPVRARVGDLVRLSVTTPQPSEVTIDALGVSASASRQVPGEVEFVASDPGRYPVLADGGASLGEVVVVP